MMMIVIPMAGLSSRFAREGYRSAKYALPLWGHPLLYWVLSSFESSFDSAHFIFVVREEDEAKGVLKGVISQHSILSHTIVELSSPTRGQAETVEQGLRAVGDCAESPLTIFNIDTIRPGCDVNTPEGDGELEVFHGEGEGWSFVLPGTNVRERRVALTTEKRRVSDLCSTGMYSFARVDYFLSALDSQRERRDWQAGELYVAPLYNEMISEGLDIRYRVVEREEVLFSGVPAEYEDLRRRPIPTLLSHLK